MTITDTPVRPVKIGDRDDWRVDYVTTGGPFIREPATTASAGNERTIANVWAGYDGYGRTRDFPELQRRCRLIASAPMLLAALKIAAETIRSYDGGDTSRHTGWKNEELLAAWIVANDAIHKAEKG